MQKHHYARITIVTSDSPKPYTLEFKIPKTQREEGRVPIFCMNLTHGISIYT